MAKLILFSIAIGSFFFASARGQGIATPEYKQCEYVPLMDVKTGDISPSAKEDAAKYFRAREHEKIGRTIEANEQMILFLKTSKIRCDLAGNKYIVSDSVAAPKLSRGSLSSGSEQATFMYIDRSAKIAKLQREISKLRLRYKETE